MDTEAVKTKAIDLKVPVYAKTGEKTGEIELPREIFGVRVNDRLLNTVLTGYGRNQRRGTHQTKERKFVRGGGRKPWKQKGTGRARAGSSRSPLWRGGGTVFGPHPRDYSVAIPKELRRQALISALSRKAKENNVVVIDEMSVEQSKTREVIGTIKALKLIGDRTLCVISGIDEKLKRATQNLKEIFAVKETRELSAYHVMRRKKLLLEKKAIPQLVERIFQERASDKKVPS